MIENNELVKLKRLLNNDNIAWDDYIARFELTKPIELRRTFRCADKDSPQILNDRAEFSGLLNNRFYLEKFNNRHALVAGFKGKVLERHLKHKQLIWLIDSMTPLLHKDVVAKMHAICPDDFEAVPVKLVSLHKYVEPFENNDFYFINVLRCIAAMDLDLSDYEFDKYGTPKFFKTFVYKDDPWQDGLRFEAVPAPTESNPNLKRSILHNFQLDKQCMIAIDAYTNGLMWHPKLASILPFNSYYWFISDYKYGGEELTKLELLQRKLTKSLKFL